MTIKCTLFRPASDTSSEEEAGRRENASPFPGLGHVSCPRVTCRLAHVIGFKRGVGGEGVRIGRMGAKMEGAAIVDVRLLPVGNRGQ